MRARILKLLLVSMVFVSVEGVSDAVDDLGFHQTHHSHADDAANPWYPDADGDENALDSCEHFCHGHSVGLIGQLLVAAIPKSGVYTLIRPAEAATQFREPPTPPPDIQS